MRRTAFRLSGLRRDIGGALLIKFTVAFLQLLSVAAVIIDLSRVPVLKRKLANALDAAALAVGTGLRCHGTDIPALAQRFINARATVTADGDVGTLDMAAARVGTVIFFILSTPHVALAGASRGLRQQRRLMTVTVTSLAMARTKRAALKIAGHGLIDNLFGSVTEPPNVKIGLVPFPVPLAR